MFLYFSQSSDLSIFKRAQLHVQLDLKENRKTKVSKHSAISREVPVVKQTSVKDSLVFASI